MSTKEKIGPVFPGPGDIPANLLTGLPFIQTRYLCGGRLRHWQGPMQDVSSPVWIQEEDGLTPFHLGRYPLLTESEALQALEAAVSAYDHGRGQWPTMNVAERIHHMEQFAYRMLEKKDIVVHLLMWEVGKSLQDSTKEFDRTIAYINQTLAALKDLDRASSRFVIDEGKAFAYQWEERVLATGPGED